MDSTTMCVDTMFIYNLTPDLKYVSDIKIYLINKYYKLIDSCKQFT